MRVIDLLELRSSSEPVLIEFEGIRVPVRFKQGSTDTLVVLFHGAVDQKKRPVPFFQSPFSDAFGAHQLSISDPCLSSKSPRLKATWYAGSPNVPLQKLLPGFFQRVCEALSIKRTIYFGGSSGGFAALFYSHAHAGSLALVANPQISLRKYLQGPVTMYRETCWPRLTSNDELYTRVCCDIAALYEPSMPNFVCLLNSSGDRSHIFDQTLELASRLKPEHQGQLILDFSFHGILGHSGSVPLQSCVPWLEAAIHAPDLYADSILSKFHELRTGPGAAPKSPVTNGPKSPPAAVPDDLRIAEALAAWQLN
jgi:hypothetical protein